MKTVFFLAETIEGRSSDGCPILILGKELAGEIHIFQSLLDVTNQQEVLSFSGLCFSLTRDTHFCTLGTKNAQIILASDKGNHY